MMKRFAALLGALVMMLGMSTMGMAAGADSLTYMTENYPPFNFEQGGQASGLSTEILAAMFSKMGSSKTAADVAVLPWAQGYKRVQEEANTCLFSMVQTEPRMTLFKWVGPIADSNIAVIVKKGSKVKIGSPADLNNYTFGVVRDDVGQQLLEQNGVTKDHLDISPKLVSGLKKLDHGRVDAVAYEQISAFVQLKANGMDSSQFEVAYVLKSSALYYAFQKDVPDSVIAEFQGALDGLRSDGTYQKIMDKYLK